MGSVNWLETSAIEVGTYQHLLIPELTKYKLQPQNIIVHLNYDLQKTLATYIANTLLTIKHTKYLEATRSWKCWRVVENGLGIQPWVKQIVILNNVGTTRTLKSQNANH